MKKNTENETLKKFEELSAVLSGFTLAEIQGTGMSEVYLNAIIEEAGEKKVNSLLGAFNDCRYKNSQTAMSNLKESQYSELIQNSIFTELVKQLIWLWYTGSMSAEATENVSGKAYTEGLIWKAVGAHPMGAKQPGFASWSFPPKTFDY